MARCRLVIHSLEELQSHLRESESVEVSTRNPYSIRTFNGVDLCGMHRILDWRPEDQMIKFESGIQLRELNQFLAKYRFEVPIGLRLEDQEYSVADLISHHLPHFRLHEGTWSSWITGMRFVEASGEVVRTGADVVKSVAGFDLHKMIIGTRFTLGIPFEISMSVRPIRPRLDDSEHQHWPRLLDSQPKMIVLALKSQFEQIVYENSDSILYKDHINRLIVSSQMIPNLPESVSFWSSFPDCAKWSEISPVAKSLMLKLKQKFDPSHKLQRGAFLDF